MRWGVALMLMSVALLAFDALEHTTNGVTNAAGEHLGRDFINYWAVARLTVNGQAALAYDLARLNAFEQSLVGAASELKVYFYPPVAMLLTLPLAWLSYGAALIAWVALGAALCFALLRRLIGWQAAAVATIGAPAAFLNILSGQNGYFTAFFLAGGLISLQRRPLVAGICFGALAYKPHMALLLPIALAADRQWRALIAAGVTGGALVLASLVLVGAPAWSAFLAHLDLSRYMLEHGQTMWHRMPTVFAAARLIGVPLGAAYAAQVISAVLAAVAIAVVWRSEASAAVKAAALLVATFLVTPYTWDYDEVVLIFAAAWLACEGMRTGFLPWERLAVAALLASPLLTMISAKLLHLQFGPVVFGCVLWLLLRRSVRHQFYPAWG